MTTMAIAVAIITTAAVIITTGRNTHTIVDTVTTKDRSTIVVMATTSATSITGVTIIIIDPSTITADTTITGGR